MSQGAADSFADACEILAQRPLLRTTTHIVGHLIRELEGDLLSVLITLPGARVVHPDKGQGHISKINAILQALHLGEHAVAGWWQSLAGEARSWAGIAHRDQFRAPRQVDEGILARVDLYIDVLGVVLDAAEANYSSVIASLNGVLTKTSPSDADFALLAPHLATGVTALAHVFETLPATWLPRLRDGRVFSQPPDVRVHDDGAISFPRWPQAAYLRRIASEVPAEVADTIASVPTVDNEAVHLDFLRAALAMPPPLAARVARHEALWLETRDRWISNLPGAVQDLGLHLVAGGELETAVAFFRAALSLEPSVRGEGRPAEPRISPWDYAQIARETLRPLWQRNAEVAKRLLFDLLGQERADHFSTWLDPIEDAGQRGINNPRDSLLSELRDLFEAEVADNEGALRRAVHELESRGGTIWNRLALHLLRMQGQNAPDLIVERACSPEGMFSGFSWSEKRRAGQGSGNVANMYSTIAISTFLSQHWAVGQAEVTIVERTAVGQQTAVRSGDREIGRSGDCDLGGVRFVYFEYFDYFRWYGRELR